MCKRCDDYDRLIKLLGDKIQAFDDAAEEVVLTKTEAVEIRNRLISDKEAYVDAAGEASWNG